MEIEHDVTVKLLFFARSKELAGTRESTIRLPTKISYKKLLNIISENYNLQTIKDNILLAKNEEVCEEEVDIEIQDRDSIAVIPPISGGYRTEPEPLLYPTKMDHLKLTVDKLSVDEITELVTADSCGAISVFIGTTRDNFEGKKVVRLEYEAYEPMALKAMKAICDEVRDKWPAIHSIAIFHRLGFVPCRESSVVIAVSSPHRRDSLDAVSHCIETLKASVPIWKKEVYEGDAPVWKENVECTVPDSTPLPTPAPNPAPPVDKTLVQINVSCEELQQRINNFIERKREQVNVSNIHDFIPDRQDDAETETCARVRTQFVRRSDSKGHLKIRKVHNEWGPQTVSAEDMYPEPADNSGLPSSIAERVVGIEKYLNIGPVSKDIYRRLKDMEDKIAELQAVSPEYAQFWKTARDTDMKQEGMVDYAFSADDIARKIEHLERGMM